MIHSISVGELDPKGAIMSFRRQRTACSWRCARLSQKIVWARIAIGVVLTIGGSMIANAQGRPGGNANAEPYTPAADAKDLKAVLWGWM